MLGALITLAIFAVCAVVGLGAVTLLSTKPKPYLPLLAPALGVSLMITPAVFLNELGAPIAYCGPPIIAVAFLGALAILWRAGDRFNLARYWPFALVCVAAFLLSAYPLFEFGFNWLSYSNDDMTNYVLNAERMVELGWYTVPNYTTYNFNQDPTVLYFINWTVNNERFGSEMLISLVLSVFRGYNGYQLFMPIMAAVALIQIVAAAGLVYRNERRRSAAILVSALMGVSALATFGMEYQLIAQVLGLPLIIASLILLCDMPDHFDWRFALLCSTALVGALLVYPEVSPFIFLAVGLFFVVRFFARRLNVKRAVLWFTSVGALSLVQLNLYIRNVLTVMESRMSQSNAGENTRIFIITFPFYLLPSGLASLFGFYSAVQDVPEPLLSLGIFCAIVLLVALAWAAVYALRKGEPAGAMVAVMLLMVGALVHQQNGFGLFKVAMYIQPFMLACFVLGWFRLARSWIKPVFAAAVIVLYAGLNVAAQQFYVDRSRALWSAKGTTFTEITNASASHLLDEFGRLSQIAQTPGVSFLSDTWNEVFAKIESYYAKPANIIFPSDNFLPGLYTLPADPIIRALQIPWTVDKAVELSALRAIYYRKPDFLFINDYGNLAFDGFFANTQAAAMERDPRGVLLLEDTAGQSVLNRWYNTDFTRNFDVVPLSSARNHVIFTVSRYGLAYYSHSRYSSLFQLEPDLFYQGKTMAGLGRRLLFHIIHPSKKIRLEVDYTETLKDDGQCILHDPSILGQTMERKYARVIGRGSARVFMPAVEPRTMVRQSYVLLDMQVNGSLFPAKKTGLMLLYGRNIPLDGRLLVGFVRDISAISEQEYDRMQPPSYLAHVAGDLQNRNLEYSGAYEDGWISEASQYVLSHPAHASVLTIHGLVPLIGNADYHTRLRVFAGNREIARTVASVGTLDLQVPVRNVPRRVPIKLLFDGFQRLPNGDQRPVAMKLYSIGFRTAQESSQESRASMFSYGQRSAWLTAMSNARIEFGSGWYPLETYAGQTFRWANNDARIMLDRPVGKNQKLAIDVEPGPGEGGHPMILHLLNAAGKQFGVTTITGRQTVEFPLLQSRDPQTYILDAEGGGTQIPSDSRILNFRVFSVRVK